MVAYQYHYNRRVLESFPQATKGRALGMQMRAGSSLLYGNANL